MGTLRRIWQRFQPHRTETIYMRLMGKHDDGVYRPVQVEPLGVGRYRVLGPVPDSERWQFAPGEIVGTDLMQFTGARHIVAVALLHSN